MGGFAFIHWLILIALVLVVVYVVRLITRRR